MKKLLTLFLSFCMLLFAPGCAFSDLLNEEKNVVNLGEKDTFVKWNLVQNDNVYRSVESAYFQFNETKFEYYENGALKKEGTHRITFFDIKKNNAPLHLNLEFGKDETGFNVFDYIDCYTEDTKDALSQFTIVSEGYHVEGVRAGGVPVRDYHLSDMPYAFGTYVKEGAQARAYKNGKVNYLGCAKLDGAFCDENGNTFHFINNSYSEKYATSEYSSYTVYMRYENRTNGTSLEGTIKLSEYDEFLGDKHHDVAMIYVMHGENEPGKESGTSVEADYLLMDFAFSDENTFTFAYGEYFYENRECEYDPANFIGGTYSKADTNAN